MSEDLNLQQMMDAFDELDFEQRTTTNLGNARNKQQMTAYIDSLDFTLRRLLILQDTVNSIVEQKQIGLLKQEHIQTYKTKIINLSRKYNISYQDVINIMVQLSR
ncbi:MAG: cupin superfamily acireductone dioxygenase involved in methionine salvage [Shewanella psychromarinicola]|jgi:cupin superfamily acireductone dioxygenase involved in methionine salvage